MNYENYEFFQIEKEKSVLIARLTRPKVNALSEDVFKELQSIVEAANADSDVISVVIASGLPNLFTVGADLKELVNKYSSCPEKAINNLNIGHATFKMIEKSPKPFIIAMKGISYGGGIELACACDIRIAAEDAKFAMPETRIGFIPGYGGTQRLPRLIGMGATKKLVMTGEPITAKEALRVGLIDEITPVDGEVERAIEIAQFIAKGAPKSTAFAKRSLNEGESKSLDVALEHEKSMFMKNIETDAWMEGLFGFIQKRPPVFERIGVTELKNEDITVEIEEVEEVPLFPALIYISGLYHLIQVTLNGTMLKNQKVLENSSIFHNLIEIEN
ncbi:MAG: enoyl-CoA hydratase/isomerase family protein [Promethearchaeota archaeon]